jgi:hypothetical protein
MIIMAKKRLFPSQKRYLEKNPIVSFRLKKEEKEKLKEIVNNTNTSVSKWVSDFVRRKVENEEEKLNLLKENEVLKDTIEELRTKIGTIIRFKIPCPVCGKDIVVTPSYLNRDWDTDIYPRLKEAFKGEIHVSCQEFLNKSYIQRNGRL